MVKNAKRRVKAKAGKRSAGRVKAKAKRVAKAQAKVTRKAKRAAQAPRMRRPLPIEAQAVGSLVVHTALDVAEAVGSAQPEAVAMDITSGLEPDQEIDQLDALDDADRAADDEADDIDGAGI